MLQRKSRRRVTKLAKTSAKKSAKKSAKRTHYAGNVTTRYATGPTITNANKRPIAVPPIEFLRPWEDPEVENNNDFYLVSQRRNGGIRRAKPLPLIKVSTGSNK